MIRPTKVSKTRWKMIGAKVKVAVCKKKSQPRSTMRNINTILKCFNFLIFGILSQCWPQSPFWRAPTKNLFSCARSISVRPLISWLKIFAEDFISCWSIILNYFSENMWTNSGWNLLDICTKTIAVVPLNFFYCIKLFHRHSHTYSIWGKGDEVYIFACRCWK